MKPGTPRRRAAALVTALAMIASTSGCGTIFHGTKQDLDLAVSPDGTKVTVERWNGEVIGGPANSPGSVTVPRPAWHEPYLVHAEKEGYCSRYWLTDSETTGGSWTYLWMMAIPALGPIVVGFTLAMIDSSTGGCCAVTPEQYNVILQKDSTCTLG